MNLPKGFKPLLAGKVEDLSQLPYPIMVSPKFDGIRNILVKGQALSRKLLEIPNRFVQQELSNVISNHPLDGELIVGEPTAPDVYNKSQSGIMSQSGEPNFLYYVFDVVMDTNMPYYDRNFILKQTRPHSRIVHVQQTIIRTVDELVEYEETVVSAGYEGAMIRRYDGPYKFGRSSTKEGILLKLKRFEDDEATIVDMIEGMHNGNEAEKDAFGRTKRSSAQAGKTPNGMMGCLVVESPKLKVGFEIGTGFTEAQRQEMWQNRTTLVGQTVKYKFQRAGMKDKPRCPVFIGMRKD